MSTRYRAIVRVPLRTTDALVIGAARVASYWARQSGLVQGRKEEALLMRRAHDTPLVERTVCDPYHIKDRSLDLELKILTSWKGFVSKDAY